MHAYLVSPLSDRVRALKSSAPRCTLEACQLSKDNVASTYYSWLLLQQHHVRKLCCGYVTLPCNSKRSTAAVEQGSNTVYYLKFSAIPATSVNSAWLQLQEYFMPLTKARRDAALAAHVPAVACSSS